MSSIFKVFDNGEGTLLALGAGGLLLVSTDAGVSWARRSVGTTKNLYDAAYTEAWGAPTFIIVGADGIILTSTDTITWLSQTSFTANDLYGIAYSGVILAVGASGAFGLSENNGVTWQNTPSGTTEDLLDITADLGAYLIVGTNDTVITGEISALALDIEIIETISITSSLESSAEFDRAIIENMEIADDLWYIHDALGAGTTLTQSGSNQFIYLTETMTIIDPNDSPTGSYNEELIESITFLSTFVDEFFRNTAGDLEWPMFVLDGEIAPGTILSGDVVWPLFSVSGKIQAPGQGAIVWPMFELEGAIVPQSEITGDVPWPMFLVEGLVTSDVLVVSTEDLEVWVLNIESDHHSTYENFQPNSFGIFNGQPFAAMPGGIFELTGEDDDGTPIEAGIYWPPSDLSDVVMKGLESVYLRLRGFIDDLNLIVIIDETEKRVFRINLEKLSDGNVTKRVPMPHGFKGQVYQFGVENQGGAGMNLFEIEVTSLPFKRRLK